MGKKKKLGIYQTSFYNCPPLQADSLSPNRRAALTTCGMPQGQAPTRRSCDCISMFLHF